jgi:hypothetical protein
MQLVKARKPFMENELQNLSQAIKRRQDGRMSGLCTLDSGAEPA